MSNNKQQPAPAFLDLPPPQPSPFAVVPGAGKPAITRVPPSAALERAKQFLACAEQVAPPPVNLELADDDEEEERVITLDLGLAPADSVPAELFRKE